MTEDAAGAAHADQPTERPQVSVSVPTIEFDVPEVTAATHRLAALVDAPIHEHPQIFDDVQRLLTTALDPQAQPASATGHPVGGR